MVCKTIYAETDTFRSLKFQMSKDALSSVISSVYFFAVSTVSCTLQYLSTPQKKFYKVFHNSHFYWNNYDLSSPLIHKNTF